MKITIVSLSRTIPTGPYMNDKIGLEASLDEGENESDALRALSSIIDKYHKEAESMRGQTVQTSTVSVMNPTYNPPPSTLTTTSGPAMEINMAYLRTKDEVEDGIIAATTLEELTQWKEKAGTYGLVSKYMDKVKSLSK